MASRIQELIKECTVVEKGPPNWTMEYNIPIERFDKEKFAKMIIQECIDILPGKVNTQDLYDVKIMIDCAQAIKDHFGE